MNAKEIWTMSYELAGKSREEKRYLLKQYFKELLHMDPVIMCENIKTFLCYYECLDEELKHEIRNLANKMKTCSYCQYCSKGEEWWNDFVEIEREFRSLIQDPYPYTGKLNEKIAVIVPNYLSAKSFCQPPIDMLMCARQLKIAGFNVEFIDNRILKYNPEELCAKIQACEYVVMTSTPYDHIQNYFLDYRLKYVFLLINYIKRYDYRKKVILCGAHGTVRPDIVFEECAADYLMRGEYDYQITPALQELISHKKAKIVYLLERTAVGIGEDTIEDDVASYNLELSDYPAYEEIHFKDYFGDVYINNFPQKMNNFGIILASRGCRYQCSFCYNFFGNNVRFRNPENIVDEMQYLEQRNVNGIFFIDSTFTQNRNWVIEICNEISRRGLKISWSAETRCDCVDEELLNIMARSNCKALWFGVESFCSNILRATAKYKNEQATYSAIELCRKSNIKPQQFIMIGAPSENRKSLNETVEGLQNLRATYVESVMVATPRFGTKYYDMAKKQYSNLGKDFFSLTGIKGLVNNEMTPDILYQTILKMKSRNFVF